MDIRKNDTERAINLLKLYKTQLNKPEEKSLRKAMDKLVDAIDSPLFTALLDIQEFYEHSLTTTQNASVMPTYTDSDKFEPQPEKVKRDKSKKKRTKTRDDREEDEEDGMERGAEYANYTVSSELKQRQQHEEQHLPEPEVEEQSPWEFFEIALSKSASGYGFGVAGGYDKPHYEGDVGIFVTKIIPGGSADVDGRLRMDDVVVTVNEVNLENVTHSTAVNTLKNAGKNMTLIIRRLREDYFATEQQQQQQQPFEEELPAGAAAADDGGVEYRENEYEFDRFELVLTKKPGGGLGFSIQGGFEPGSGVAEEDSYISVSRLTPAGLAETDGRLMINDILLMVDNQTLTGLTHEEVVDMLKSTGKQVKLYVGRFIPAAVHEEPPVEKPEKKKKKKHRRERAEE